MAKNESPSGAHLLNMLRVRSPKQINELINKMINEMGYPDYIGYHDQGTSPGGHDLTRAMFLYVNKRVSVTVDYFYPNRKLFYNSIGDINSPGGFHGVPKEVLIQLKKNNPTSIALREVFRKEDAAKAAEVAAKAAEREAAVKEAEATDKLVKKITKRHSAEINAMGIPTSALDSIVIFPNMTLVITSDTTNNDMFKNERVGSLRDALTLMLEVPEIKISGINYWNTIGFKIKMPGQPSLGYLFVQDDGDLYLKYVVAGDNGEAQTLSTLEAYMVGDAFKSTMKAGVRSAKP